MVIPNFIQKALSGEDIPVYGDGTQRRCFTYVGDAVDICYRISQLPESTNQIINLGNDKSISIVDLAEIVLKKTGSNVKKVYIPYEQVYGKDFEDCQNRVPSTKKLFSIIGSYKFTEIEKIIELIIKHDYADLMNDHKYCALQEDVYNVRFK
jgi:UDP-glucose 4-epimerase